MSNKTADILCYVFLGVIGVLFIATIPITQAHPTLDMLVTNWGDPIYREIPVKVTKMVLVGNEWHEHLQPRSYWTLDPNHLMIFIPDSDPNHLTKVKIETWPLVDYITFSEIK